MFDTEKFINEVEERPPLYNVQLKSYTNKEVKATCWAEIGKVMYKDWSTVSPFVKNERAKDLMKKWKAIRDNFVRCHRQITQTGTGKPANNKRPYTYYQRLQFLVPYVKVNTNTSSNITVQTRTQNDAEDLQDTLYQTANRTVEDSQSITEARASPLTDTNATCIPNKKRKRKNLQKQAAKRVTTEQSIASSTNELSSILSKSLALQRKQAYQEKEQQADLYGHQAFLMSFVPVLNSMPFLVAMEARLKITELVTSFLQNLAASTRNHNNTSAGWSNSGCSTPAPSTSFTSDSNSEDYNISDYILLENTVQND